MRRLLTIVLLASCGAPTAPPGAIELGQRYVGDQAFRRAELQRSVVNPDNAYSALRLEQYGRGEGWDALEPWSPAVTPLFRADFGTFDREGRRPTTGGERAPQVDWTHESLMKAGRWVFETYPMVVDARLAPLLASEENTAEAGLWVDDDGRLGGLVAVSGDDGDEGIAWTCATCHSSIDGGGQLVVGRTNDRFDSGALYRIGGEPNATIEAWGPGRVDSSRDGTDNPALITDLRAIRHQSHLHHTATLRNGLVALAIRAETLLIVSQEQRRRPPRDLAFALAYFMWNLSPAGVEPVGEGWALFEEHCAECHAVDGSTAPPVEPLRVGTNPDLQDAPGRGTGLYRIPSLVGVALRPRLLHDGSVESLEDLLDPARTRQVPGHTFGHELDEDERRRLLGFVRSF